MTYKTKGTCSSQIDFDLKDGKYTMFVLPADVTAT